MTFNRGYGAGAASNIDSGSYFNGVYRSPGDLRVEGEFEGEIQCDGTLTVAEAARVSGAVTAGHVSVSGQLRGQVECSGRFEILATGQVSARVLTGSVIVREGAFYDGEMRMHVAPDGLTERERTVVLEVLQDDPAHLAASPNGREMPEATTLHAVTE